MSHENIREDVVGETPATYGKSSIDVIIELLRKDIDQTQIIENLRLTPTQRIQKLITGMAMFEAVQQAGNKARTKAGEHD